MGVEKFACRVEVEQQGRRLDQFLAQVLCERLSRRQIKKLIAIGAVYVDGKRVRVASRKVRPSAWIEVYVDASASVPTSEVEPPDILYEDEYLIAVDKPSGIPAQATQTDAHNDLFSQLRRYLGQRGDARAPSRTPYLALHHRLDRGTSGVMLFARHRRVNRGLATAFAERRVRKVYHALSAMGALEPPSGSWTVKSYLSPPRSSPSGRRRVTSSASLAAGEIRPGSRFAETEFRLLQWFPGALWIEAVPKTGRTHQIRVHLADSDLPVLGDRLYGRDAVPQIPAPRLMLHAVSLTLEHPVTGEALVIESPLPEDFREEVRLLEFAAPEPDITGSLVGADPERT